MKLDVNKIEAIMARNKQTYNNLRSAASPSTLMKIRDDPYYDVRPSTAGKIADVLGVEPEQIMK